MTAFIGEHSRPLRRRADLQDPGHVGVRLLPAAAGQRSDRVIEDERLLELIETTHEANYCAYGYRKMWLALKRAGHEVGRDRVKRLMRQHGIRGAKRRGKPWRTTVANPAATRSPAVVDAKLGFSETGGEAPRPGCWSTPRCS